MKLGLTELDRSVAKARIVLSVVVLLSMYVDPTTGGLFGIGAYQLTIVLLYLTYGLGTYLTISHELVTKEVFWVTAAADIIFASLLALFSEGPTSPALALFMFAIIAAGCWADLRSILIVTLFSVVLYLVAILRSGSGIASPYLMRAAYLGIAGYLIAFFGQQRQKFDAKVRELEADAERQTIARSLHDGYIQALTGIGLRLESCRDMLIGDQPAQALTELGEIQAAVSREHDEVRDYVRTLGGADRIGRALPGFTTQFRVQARFAARGAIVEQVLQILLEGARNAQRHGQARSASINVEGAGDAIRITIDDDGVGFGDTKVPPWTIASRVAEFGGRLTIRSDNSVGAHLEIEMPAA